MPAEKLYTTNVITMYQGSFAEIQAFPDTPEGNEQAEAVFKQKVYELMPDTTDEDMQALLDEGNYDDCNGYELVLIHSS